jgi:hypothetical protein
MSENMKFDLGTVLTITTGVLLTKIDNVYKILDYMTGDSLFTHQLPRVGRECEPILLSQFPQLKGIDVSGVNSENWNAFLQKQIEIFGNEFEVIPVSLFEHKRIDPLEELESMVDPSKIIVLNPESL